MISFYTRALLLFRCPPCWNKHGAARTLRHDTSCLSCRDVTQQVEFGLQSVPKTHKIEYRCRFSESKVGTEFWNVMCLEKTTSISGADFRLRLERSCSARGGFLRIT